jgi:hypothetical protein
VLHALLEVCDEFTADEHARRLPSMDLALHACRMELQRLGVTHAPPPNEAAVRLSATESQLAARVHDLEAALRQWDAAAAPASAPVPTPAGELEAQNANASVLSLLPEVPTHTIFRGVLPFMLADVVRLGILIAFPAISLWLPSLMK